MIMFRSCNSYSYTLYDIFIIGSIIDVMGKVLLLLLAIIVIVTYSVIRYNVESKVY